MAIIRSIIVALACCCGVTTSCFSCRTRGGTATLCGLEEYTSPSSPPKKYRTGTITKNTHSTSTSDGFTVCNPGPFSCMANRTTIEGTLSFSALDCSITECPVETRYTQPSPSSCDLEEGEPEEFCGADAEILACGGSPTVTPTSWTETRSESGELSCGEGVAGDYTFECSSNGSLSDEDTDADAIARAQTSAWGEWGEVCSATWEQRVSGFSFAYQDAQWRITESGLTPSTSYDFTVEYWRRPYGGGPGDWVLFATLALSESTDGSGDLITTEEDIPNVAGYETEARCDCVFTLTPPP